MQSINQNAKQKQCAYHLPEKSCWADRMHNGKEVTILCDQPDRMDLTISQTGKCDWQVQFPPSPLPPFSQRKD